MGHDVAVVGAGLVGSALARRCAAAGLDTVCLGPTDASGPPSSHRDSGRITRLLDGSRIWAELARRSIAEYADIERRSGTPFHRPVGLLWAAPPSVLEAFGPLISDWSIEVEHSSAWPGLELPPDTDVLLERGDAGYIRPIEMAKAQRRIASAEGARFDDAAAIAIEARGDGWHVARQGAETLVADRVVVTAGAQSGFLADVPISASAETVLQIEVSAEIGARRADLPCVAVFAEDASTIIGYFTPPIMHDGAWRLKFGSEIDPSPTLDTPEQVIDWMASRPDSGAFVSTVRRLLPDAEFLSITAQPCIYARTPTGLPIVDELEPGLFVAAGGNGRMAKSADAVAALAARLVIAGEWDDSLDHSMFTGRPG